MRILVYGAGSLGSLLGGILSLENDVVMVAREDHVRAIETNGLLLINKTGREYIIGDKKWKTGGALRTFPRAFRGLSEMKDDERRADVVLLTTKSYDVAAACEDIRQSMTPVPVVGFQNGVAHPPVMKKNLWSHECVYLGITSVGARKIGAGVVEYTGAGRVYIWGPDQEKAETIAGVFRVGEKIGWTVERVENPWPHLWEKNMVNLAINPLTALSCVENGYVEKLASETFGQIYLKKLLAEGVVAARSDGVELDASATFNRVIEVARLTAPNRSSMLQDLENRKKTEREAILGEVLRRNSNAARAWTLYSLLSLVEKKTVVGTDEQKR